MTLKLRTPTTPPTTTTIITTAAAGGACLCWWPTGHGSLFQHTDEVGREVLSFLR